MPRILKPRHFTEYGSGGRTLCGLLRGRSGKGYIKRPYTPEEEAMDWRKRRPLWEKVESDVSWDRSSFRLEKTTCAACLIVMLKQAGAQLKQRLASTRRSLRDELKHCDTEKMMGELKRVVGTGRT